MKAIWKLEIGGEIRRFKLCANLNRDDVYNMATLRFNAYVVVISREGFERVNI